MSLIIYFSFAFALSEILLLLVKRSVKTTSKTRNDRGSLIFLWLMITCGFISGFFLSEPKNDFLAGFGFLFIAGGLIVRWVAILQLGESFTVDVAVTASAKLKTDGIYEIIRHPSYLGILLVVFGFSCAMNSFYSFLVLVVPVFIAVIYRINVEEKVLIAEFGEQYTVYMSDTKRLIPGLY